jgi:Na+-translocating ferredoxin:NAD+ oxidoreductase RnfC subunit
VCTDGCPEAGVAPHELLTTLVHARDEVAGPLGALACTACGLCDVLCPTGLAPKALITEVSARLRAVAPDARAPRRGARAPGLDVALLTQRLGLAEYQRPLRYEL